MLNTQALQKEILALLPAVRQVVAKVLRSSRYYSDDHIDDCMADIRLQILDYGMRTFDPAKGSARSHFTCFGKARALNWLHTAHRRFETSDRQIASDDGETVSVIDNAPAVGDPFMLLVRAQEAARIRAAISALEPRQRALLSAFERTMSWSAAAKEIGVSPATASRMKAQIATQLR